MKADGMKKSAARKLWQKLSKDRKWYIIEHGILKVGIALDIEKVSQQGVENNEEHAYGLGENVDCDVVEDKRAEMNKEYKDSLNIIATLVAAAAWLG